VATSSGIFFSIDLPINEASDRAAQIQSFAKGSANGSDRAFAVLQDPAYERTEALEKGSSVAPVAGSSRSHRPLQPQIPSCARPRLACWHAIAQPLISRRHKETPYSAVDAEVLMKEHPRDAVLTPRYSPGSAMGRCSLHSRQRRGVEPAQVADDWTSFGPQQALLTHAETCLPLDQESCAKVSFIGRVNQAASGMLNRSKATGSPIVICIYPPKIMTLRAFATSS
jgi:hypothetical protein